MGQEGIGEMPNKILVVVFAVVLLGGVLVPVARADQDNREVLFTVTGPVELPGEVLGPGRYELKLQGDGSPIAGVWNANGQQFYGYFITIPVDRVHANGRSRVVLAESVKGAPEKIERWFYGGDTNGNEFLYPVSHTCQCATAFNARRTLGN